MDSRRKRNTLAEDRISALPDAILCHILSFLEPEFRKCVVSTSILSKRWKNIWTYVPNIYFDDCDFPSSADFIAYVDHALQIRDSAPIRKFHLRFSSVNAEDFSRVHDWMITAVKCNVVELDLSVEPNADLDENLEMFELPESLLTCDIILVLKLLLNFSIRVPRGGCYSSLKELHLEFMYPNLIHQENNLMDFSQFPVLEYLGIDGYLGLHSFTFIIFGPKLKTLRIRSKTEDAFHVPHIFQISAPNLERLDAEDDSLSHYTLVNTRSLVEVNVRADTEQATKFLAGISTVKCLVISSDFLSACYVAAFDNLRELKVVLERDYTNWSLLAKVLGRLSSLESLVVEDERYAPLFHHGDSELVDNLEEFEEANEVSAVELLWNPPEFVPNCLPSHLKTICIKGFKGSQFLGYRDEKEVIKYLLKNSQVLQTMTISSPGLSNVAEMKLVRKLSMLEWGSKDCQVEVNTKVVHQCRS